MNYVYLILIIIVINLPFGFLKSRYKKFSIPWLLYLHVPVPFVIYLRKVFDTELTLLFAPFYFGSYLLGQWLGRKFFEYRSKK